MTFRFDLGEVVAQILWLDDQLDVAKTFAGVIGGRHRVTFASSGEAGIERLKTSYFDVVIVDLLMPPGKWGGLWFLEEVQRLRLRVPIVVLSGEGDQVETIKALRLGAKDYVTKDSVQTDLAQRVEAVAAKHTAEVTSAAAHSLPIPISVAYGRVRCSLEPCSELRRTIECFEHSLRMCGLVGLSELDACGCAGTFPPSLAMGLARPSMGLWDQLRQWLSEQLTADGPFGQVNSALTPTVVAEAVKLRNDYVHGGEPSEKNAERLLVVWRERLLELLARMWARVRFQIILPRTLRFDGVSVQAEGHYLAGGSFTLPRYEGLEKGMLICDHAYVLGDEEGIWHTFQVFPFLAVERAIEANCWRVFVFDGFTMGRVGNVTGGTLLLRYIELNSGTRSEPASKLTVDLLPGYLRMALSC